MANEFEHGRDSMILVNFKEAERYAESTFWVKPIQIGEIDINGNLALYTEEDVKFWQRFRVADESTDGRVHYARI